MPINEPLYEKIDALKKARISDEEINANLQSLGESHKKVGFITKLFGALNVPQQALIAGPLAHPELPLADAIREGYNRSMRGDYITYQETAKARGWDVPESNWGRVAAEIGFAFADPLIAIPIGSLYAKSSRILGPAMKAAGKIYGGATLPLKKIPLVGPPAYMATHPFKSMKSFVQPIWESNFGAIAGAARQNKWFDFIFGRIVNLDREKKQFMAGFAAKFGLIMEKHGIKKEKQMFQAIASLYYHETGEMAKLGIKIPQKTLAVGKEVREWLDEFIPIAQKRMADETVLAAMEMKKGRVYKEIDAKIRKMVKGGLTPEEAFKAATAEVGKTRFRTLERMLKGKKWEPRKAYLPYSLPVLKDVPEMQRYIAGNMKEYTNVLKHLKESQLDARKLKLHLREIADFDARFAKGVPTNVPPFPRKGNIPSFEYPRLAGVYGPGKRTQQELFMSYANTVANGLFWDQAYPILRQGFHLIDDPHLKEIYWKWFRSMAGVTERESARTWGRAFQRLGEFIGSKTLREAGETTQGLSKIADKVAEVQYMCKLGFSPLRFPMVNLTQPMLTLLPYVGIRSFMKGFFRSLAGGTGTMTTAKGRAMYDLAKEWQVFQPVERAMTEAVMRKQMPAWQRVATLPQRASESWNRQFSFSAGLEDAVRKKMIKNVDIDILEPYMKGKKLSVGAEKAVRHAVDVAATTQFPYTRVTMALFTASPGKRLIWQFKNFLSYYIDFLAKAKAEDPRKFAHAIAALIAVGGTGSIPFYDSVRPELMRMGVNLPEFNTLEAITRGCYPFRGPGIDIGSSLEPFNIPKDVSWVFGPTFGPMVAAVVGGAKEAELGISKAAQALGMIAPAPYRAAKGLLYPEPTTRAAGKARVIAKRSLEEILYLRPSAESVRWRYMRVIEAAMQAGDMRLARGFIRQAKREGVLIAKKDISTLKGRIKRRRTMPRDLSETIGRALSGEIPFASAEKGIREFIGR